MSKASKQDNSSRGEIFSPTNKLTGKFDAAWWARETVFAIPCAGGPIDSIISAGAQEISQTRVKRIFSCLAEEIERLADKVIDQQFLVSDEGVDLLRLAFEKCLRRRQGGICVR